jgi:hypothetical protein
MKYKLLPGRDQNGRFRVKVRGQDEVLHFEPQEVSIRAIGLYYRPLGERYATTRYETPRSLIQMKSNAMKEIFNLTDDGYEHVIEKAKAMMEIWK